MWLFKAIFGIKIDIKQFIASGILPHLTAYIIGIK